MEPITNPNCSVVIDDMLAGADDALAAERAAATVAAAYGANPACSVVIDDMLAGADDPDATERAAEILGRDY